MHARIVTFRLDGPSHAEYARQAVAIAEGLEQSPGLLAKVWLADEGEGRYGGVYLFESAAAIAASRRSPELLSIRSLPVFTDVQVEEFDVLDAPTAITGGPLAGLRTAS